MWELYHQIILSVEKKNIKVSFVILEVVDNGNEADRKVILV